MKLNKDKLKELTPYFVMGAITLGTSGFFAKYYLPDNFSDNVKQEGDINIDESSIEVIDGELYYYFDAYQHKVVMSQNDAFYRKIEAVDEYTITDVEVNGWRDNSKVTFVNEVPVRVKVTGNVDGILKFDGFGEVVENNKKLIR